MVLQRALTPIRLPSSPAETLRSWRRSSFITPFSSRVDSHDIHRRPFTSTTALQGKEEDPLLNLPSRRSHLLKTHSFRDPNALKTAARPIPSREDQAEQKKTYRNLAAVFGLACAVFWVSNHYRASSTYDEQFGGSGGEDGKRLFAADRWIRLKVQGTKRMGPMDEMVRVDLEIPEGTEVADPPRAQLFPNDSSSSTPKFDYSLQHVSLKQPDLQIQRPYTPLVWPPPGHDSAPRSLTLLIKAYPYPEGEVSRWIYSHVPNGGLLGIRGVQDSWSSSWGMPKRGSRERRKVDEWEKVVFIVGGTGVTPVVQFANKMLNFHRQTSSLPTISSTSEPTPSTLTSTPNPGLPSVSVLYSTRNPHAQELFDPTSNPGALPTKPNNNEEPAIFKATSEAFSGSANAVEREPWNKPKVPLKKDLEAIRKSLPDRQLNVEYYLTGDPSQVKGDKNNDKDVSKEAALPSPITAAAQKQKIATQAVSSSSSRSWSSYLGLGSMLSSDSSQQHPSLPSGEKLGRIAKTDVERMLGKRPTDWKVDNEPTTKGRTLVLVCGPESFVTQVAGRRGPNFTQGEVGGILKELGWTEEEVWKL